MAEAMNPFAKPFVPKSPLPQSPAGAQSLASPQIRKFFPHKPMTYPRMQDTETLKNVWANNFAEEFDKMMQIVDSGNYPLVGMDSEFGGNVYEPMGGFFWCSDFDFLNIYLNCQAVPLMQVGFSFADKDFKVPQGVCSWQFNLFFDKAKECYNKESIEFLRNTGQMSMKKLHDKGIKLADFVEKIRNSSLIGNNNITYVVFHGGSDFAHLMRALEVIPMMSVKDLVNGLKDNAAKKMFLKKLSETFPSFFDLKTCLDNNNMGHYGLNALSDLVLVKSPNKPTLDEISHQSGFDARHTLEVFDAMLERGDLWMKPQRGAPNKYQVYDYLMNKFENVLARCGDTKNLNNIYPNDLKVDHRLETLLRKNWENEFDYRHATIETITEWMMSWEEEYKKNLEKAKQERKANPRKFLDYDEIYDNEKPFLPDYRLRISPKHFTGFVAKYKSPLP